MIVPASIITPAFQPSGRGKRKKEENILYLKERNWWLHVLIWITVCWPESYTKLKRSLENILFILGGRLPNWNLGTLLIRGKWKNWYWRLATVWIPSKKYHDHVFVCVKGSLCSWIKRNYLQRTHFSGFHHPKCFEVGKDLDRRSEEWNNWLLCESKSTKKEKFS